jgi:hypothetical protein
MKLVRPEAPHSAPKIPTTSGSSSLRQRPETSVDDCILPFHNDPRIDLAQRSRNTSSFLRNPHHQRLLCIEQYHKTINGLPGIRNRSCQISIKLSEPHPTQCSSVASPHIVHPQLRSHAPPLLQCPRIYTSLLYLIPCTTPIEPVSIEIFASTIQGIHCALFHHPSNVRFLENFECQKFPTVVDVLVPARPLDVIASSSQS